MPLNKTLTINEIFHSIQGESYLAGLPCIFIRLTGCHQRCVYCDTEHAFYEGKKMTIADIMAHIKKYPCRNVLVTGGEPLLQANSIDLMTALVQEGYSVAVETSGNLDISQVPPGVVKVMDLKTPSSGECEKNNYGNLRFLDKKDEVKFVVMNGQDIEWSIATIVERQLDQTSHVSISPTDLALHPMIADHILKSGRKIRQQTQLHKLIWPDKERGV